MLAQGEVGGEQVLELLFQGKQLQAPLVVGRWVVGEVVVEVVAWHRLEVEVEEARISLKGVVLVALADVHYRHDELLELDEVVTLSILVWAGKEVVGKQGGSHG